jgi:hypothetical protein
VLFERQLKTAEKSGITGITGKTLPQLSFSARGNCTGFPDGFKAIYYVENHPQAPRDKAVLRPVPDRFKEFQNEF